MEIKCPSCGFVTPVETNVDLPEDGDFTFCVSQETVSVFVHRLQKT